jgi:hypothetical protein
MVTFQDELGIKTVARWLVDSLAAEVSVELVFVIVVFSKLRISHRARASSRSMTSCAVFHGWSGFRNSPEPKTDP